MLANVSSTCQAAVADEPSSRTCGGSSWGHSSSCCGAALHPEDSALPPQAPDGRGTSTE